MPRYSSGTRTVAAASGAAFATLHTGARVARIYKAGVIITAATATSIGIIRPSNTPVATTSVLGLPLDTQDATATVNVDTAWSTAPTIGTVFLARYDFTNVIGSGYVDLWRDDAPIVVAASSWLVFWNFGGGSGAVCDLNLEWEE